MIGQITPLVKEAGWQTWAKAAVACSAGCTLSSAALGWTLGVIGFAVGLHHSRLLPIAGIVLMLGAMRDAAFPTSRLPSLARQTPKWYARAFGPMWGSFAWGLDLGQGWTTRITSAGYFAAVLVTLLLVGPYAGAAAFACFGLGRALPVAANGLLAIRYNSGRLYYPYEMDGALARWVGFGATAFAAGYLVAR